MKKIYCDICEVEMFHQGIQQAERTVVFKGKDGDTLEALVTVRVESERDPDICNRCVMASLQGVDEKSENAWCGHERVGRVTAGTGDNMVTYTCCDKDHCKNRLVNLAEHDSGGQSAFFYRDTIGG